MTSCGSGSTPQSELGTTSQPAVVQKAYPRKIYVHMMPWFLVGGPHWSMNARNPATGVASWYSPMIGEYSSNDAVVIEYQLLTMKYAGIDGVLIDWPGLAGQADLPRNKANADAIITDERDGVRSAAWLRGPVRRRGSGERHGVRSRQLLFKPNRIEINSLPAILVFGLSSHPTDWTVFCRRFDRHVSPLQQPTRH